MTPTTKEPRPRANDRHGLRDRARRLLFPVLESWAPTLAIQFARRPGTLGRLGEALAARYLADQGWSVLGRGVRTPFAEIDLVCRRADSLICVEVKTGWTRTDRPGQLLPRDRLRPRRLERQRQAARFLAKRHGLPAKRSRVDLFEWTLAGPKGCLWRRLEGCHLRDVAHGPGHGRGRGQSGPF